MYVIIYASVKYTANGTQKWVKMVKNLAISYAFFRQSRRKMQHGLPLSKRELVNISNS